MFIKKLVLGLSWISALRVSTRILAFVKIFVIARLLSPSQFGVFGIASLILSILEVLTEPGINVFFIQKEGKIRQYLNSAWTLSIVRGFFLGVLIFAFSPLTLSFLSLSEAEKIDCENILRLIAFVPVIKGFVNPAVVSFLQDLNFRKEFIFRFVIFFIDAGIAIFSALIYPHPLCFVYGLIAGALMEVALSFIFVAKRPNFEFSAGKIKHILSRGKWITLHGISEFVYRNIDDFFVTKVFGPYYLGIYQMAYKIAVLPITEIADVFGKVSFPMYAKVISKNKDSLNLILAKSSIFMILLLLPFIVFMNLYASGIILFVLGDQWLNTVSLIKILVVYSFIRSLINPLLTYMLVCKKQEYLAYVSGTTMLILIFLLIYLGYKFGVNGVALAVSISSFFSLLITLYLFLKLKGQELRR
ncbi:MAG: oligosaccharide flippase family protein [Patescibacteria group bacterium]|nr:oligosaccharide flippase family protein [Patescibacteria group bacterium]